MRFFIPLLFASPTAAWEFTPTPICTLSAPTEKGEVRVTYDPADAIYQIQLTYVLDDLAWQDAPIFAMEFIGARSLTISTDRHVISQDAKTISVTDTGFGNVLDGLEFNAIAQGQAGSSTMVMPLAGAAEPVQAFRACTVAGVS